MTPVRKEIQNRLSVSGPVSGTDSVDVVSNLHAEVLEIPVKEGDKVTKGQILAVLDDTDLKKEVAMAKNDYDLAVSTCAEQDRDARNGYAKAVQDLKTAQDNYNRTKVLYDSGDVPLVDLETAENGLNDAKRQAASYEVKNGQAVAGDSYRLQVEKARFEYEKKQEQLADNAKKISEAGADLYNTCSILSGHFSSLGKSLNQAVAQYNKTVSSFEHRFIPRAQKLKNLGVTSTKELPRSLEDITEQAKSADVPELMARPSLRNSRMYPIYVDEPDIAPAQMKSPGFSGMRNRSIVLAGIPVAEMAGGSHPLFNPVFVSGNPQEAYAMLESTRSLLIPDTFARTVGLKVGDALMLVNPSSRERRSGNEPSAGIRGRGRGGAVRGEPWKVAGIVSFPGWHWLTKTSGMRVRRGGFVAALAIADERWLKEEYAHQGFQFIWGDTAPGISNVELQNDLGEYALMKVREQENGGEGAKPLVKALTRESLGGSVTSRGDDVIFTMSKLPIIMMVIAVLAVLNTVLASVQSRRREFGLMRAVGVPGGMVMRMLWAETLMVSLCSVVMSLVLGVLGAWCSIQILEYGYHFGVVTPPVTMPWAHLACAVLLVLSLSSLACLLPAWRMKHASVTDLLSVREG